MNCKFCNAELSHDAVFCHICGKNQQEAEQLPVDPEQIPEEAVCAEEDAAPEEEAVPEEVSAEEPAEEPAEESAPAEAAKVPEQKAAAEKQASSQENLWKIIAIVACGILAALLALMIWRSVEQNRPEPTTAATTTAPGTIYDSYQGNSDQLREAANTVVAQVGEHQLTNRQLQTIYWAEFYTFVENYGNYLTNLGLDYTQPLNTQGVPEGDQSWEQFFVDLALNSWHKHVVLGMEAKKQGMELTEENRKNLETFPSLLEENAGSYGFASAQEMIESDFGEGITMEDYLWYLELQYLGQQYYNQLYESQEVTREEVSDYFDENASNYQSYGITKDSGNLQDVRHILLQPEGAEISETTGYVTATDEQWEACRLAAQEILDGWAAGEATEESFAALAGEHSVDPGSAENGGLYATVSKGQMVEAFDTWLFAEERQVGDTGLVKTEFGYHIMYYVGGEEGWYVAAKPDLIQSKTQAILDQLREAVTLESFKEKIVLDSTVLGVYKEQDAASGS